VMTDGSHRVRVCAVPGVVGEVGAEGCGRMSHIAHRHARPPLLIFSRSNSNREKKEDINNCACLH
jgi:hypothetical protein